MKKKTAQRTGTRRPQTGHAAPYRRIILGLVRALCEVPREVRDLWKDELGAKEEELTPDETIVQLVLINLGVGESFAERRAEEQRPRLYPVVGRDGRLGPSTVTASEQV